MTGYDAIKERARERAEKLSASGRDIAADGWVHEPLNLERRQACERDFRRFCESYFPHTFNLAWSDDHLKVIHRIETVVLEGGQFALAMPRGNGKTSLCETATIWAMVYGHRFFPVVIGATESHAERMLDAIKSEIETNDLLEEDFSEVVGPVRAMEGIHQRAAGQLYAGERTRMGWTARDIVLPTLPPLEWAPFNGQRPPSGGTVVRVAGLTGHIRGMKFKTADGRNIRPDLVLIDDPQTDESARSPSQSAQRERILAGAVLGLAGPGKRIAALMPTTVVVDGDMADRILDREKHPEWQGERTRMVYAFPSNEKLWDEYAEIRKDDGVDRDAAVRRANAFYRKHRPAMDAGAAVAWEARKEPDELSAVQHAMNLKIDRGDAAFFAEYQNDPLPETEQPADLLDAAEIGRKLNGHRRGEIPDGCTALTAFIDVQQKCLWWLIVAWELDFTGYVVAYGTEPEQNRRYFTLREVRKTLAVAAPGAGLEGSIYAGLERLTERILGREWRRADGGVLRIDRCLIDAQWGESTAVVHKFCRQSQHAAILVPSGGMYVGAASKPLNDYAKKRGDRVGLNWRLPARPGRGSVRKVLYDSNYWKSFVHARLAVPMGDPGCLSLYGRDAAAHRMLIDHLTAEYPVRVEGRGRTVSEWKIRSGGRDNHWFDCLVGAAVAASMQGVSLPSMDATPVTAAREHVSFAELQRRARARGRS